MWLGSCVAVVVAEAQLPLIRPVAQELHMSQVRSLKKKRKRWSSRPGSVVTNPSSVHDDVGLIPGLAQRAKDPALP